MVTILFSIERWKVFVHSASRLSIKKNAKIIELLGGEHRISFVFSVRTHCITTQKKKKNEGTEAGG